LLKRILLSVSLDLWSGFNYLLLVTLKRSLTDAGRWLAAVLVAGAVDLPLAALMVYQTTRRPNKPIATLQWAQNK